MNLQYSKLDADFVVSAVLILQTSTKPEESW